MLEAQTLHRVKMAQLKKKGTSRMSRYAPFGYRFVGKEKRVDREEQSVIKKVKVLRKLGYTMQEIADHLRVDGHRSRNGKPFHVSMVHRILSRNRPKK